MAGGRFGFGEHVGQGGRLPPLRYLRARGRPSHAGTPPPPPPRRSCGVMLYVMLVGAYPFERPEDKHDNQKLQKMIQRILHVDYHVPSHIRLSDDCKDLLKKVEGRGRVGVGRGGGLGRGSRGWGPQQGRGTPAGV